MQYGYMVVCSGTRPDRRSFPLHIVETKTDMFHCFSVFTTAAAAREHITRNKADFPGLVYNPEFSFTKSLVKAYTDPAAKLFCSLKNRQLYVA